jgi:class 3 adenylate cyclase
MAAKCAHRSFVVVDVEKFASRSDDDQRWLRKQMYDVVETAADAAGIPWDRCDRQDQGDCIVALIPSEVSKDDIADGFVARLDAGLARYARRSTEDVRMRMRLGLHAGEVVRDEHGWVGRALNTACRLVDLPESRATLAAARGSHLVVVVSDLWFSTVVSRDPGLVDHTLYRRVPFRVKEIDEWAWIHVPGGRLLSLRASVNGTSDGGRLIGGSPTPGARCP